MKGLMIGPTQETLYVLVSVLALVAVIATVHSAYAENGLTTSNAWSQVLGSGQTTVPTSSPSTSNPQSGYSTQNQIFTTSQSYDSTNTYRNSQYSFSYSPPTGWQQISAKSSNNNSILVAVFADGGSMNFISIRYSIMDSQSSGALFSASDSNLIDIVKSVVLANGNNVNLIQDHIDRYSDGDKVSFTVTMQDPGGNPEEMESVNFLTEDGKWYTLNYFSDPTNFGNFKSVFENSVGTFYAGSSSNSETPTSQSTISYLTSQCQQKYGAGFYYDASQNACLPPGGSWATYSGGSSGTSSVSSSSGQSGNNYNQNPGYASTAQTGTNLQQGSNQITSQLFKLTTFQDGSTIAIPPGWTIKSYNGLGFQVTPQGSNEPMAFIVAVPVSDIGFYMTAASCERQGYSNPFAPSSCFLRAGQKQLEDSSYEWQAGDAIQSVIHLVSSNGIMVNKPTVIPVSNVLTQYQTSLQLNGVMLDEWGYVQMNYVQNPIFSQVAGKQEVTSLAFITGCDASPSQAAQFDSVCKTVLWSFKPSQNWYHGIVDHIMQTYQQELQGYIQLESGQLQNNQVQLNIINQNGNYMQSMQNQLFNTFQQSNYKSYLSGMQMFALNNLYQDPNNPSNAYWAPQMPNPCLTVTNNVVPSGSASINDPCQTNLQVYSPLP